MATIVANPAPNRAGQGNGPVQSTTQHFHDPRKIDAADTLKVNKYPALGSPNLNNQAVRQSIKNVADVAHKKQGWTRYAMPIALFVGGLATTVLCLVATNPVVGASLIHALGGSMLGVAAVGGAILIASLIVAAIIRKVRLNKVEAQMFDDKTMLGYALKDIENNITGQTPSHAEKAMMSEAQGALRLASGNFFGERGFWRATLMGTVAALVSPGSVYGYLFGKSRADSGYPTRRLGDEDPARVDALRTEAAYTLNYR